jgi:hypothetical protein
VSTRDSAPTPVGKLWWDRAPENLPAAFAGAGALRLAGEVDLFESLGSELQVHFRIDADPVRPKDATPQEQGGQNNAATSAHVQPA